MYNDLDDIILDKISKIIHEKKIYEEARTALIDTLTIATAAYKLEPTAQKYTENTLKNKTKTQGIPLPGPWKKTDETTISAILAFNAHSLELDDWLRPGYVHAGTIITPIIYTLSILHKLTLRETLTFLTVGYEATGLIGGLLGGEHYKKYHTTTTAGAYGAALTAALIKGYSIEEAHKLGLTSLLYIGGSWTAAGDPEIKPLGPATSVLVGLNTINYGGYVKRRKLDTREVCMILEGECNKAILSYKNPLITENGFKLYPTCRHTHTVIEAANKIHEETTREELEKADTITIEVYGTALEKAGYNKLPVDRFQARFSILYTGLYTLLYGPPTVRGLIEKLGDPLIMRLARKTIVRERDEYTRLYPKEMPARVTIELPGREKIIGEAYIPRGDPGTVKLEDILLKAEQLGEEAGDENISILAHDLAKLSYSDTLEELLLHLNY